MGISVGIKTSLTGALCLKCALCPSIHGSIPASSPWAPVTQVSPTVLAQTPQHPPLLQGSLIQTNQTLPSFLRSTWLPSRTGTCFSRGLPYRMNCLFITNTVRGLSCCSASHRLSSPESIPITELAALPSCSFLPYNNNFILEQLPNGTV